MNIAPQHLANADIRKFKHTGGAVPYLMLPLQGPYMEGCGFDVRVIGGRIQRVNVGDTVSYMPPAPGRTDALVVSVEKGVA